MSASPIRYLAAVPNMAAMAAAGAVGNTVIHGLNGVDDALVFGYAYNPINDSSHFRYQLEMPGATAVYLVAKTCNAAVTIPMSLATGCLSGITRGLAEGLRAADDNRWPNVGATLDAFMPRTSPWWPELAAYNMRWF